MTKESGGDATKDHVPLRSSQTSKSAVSAACAEALLDIDLNKLPPFPLALLTEPAGSSAGKRRGLDAGAVSIATPWSAIIAVSAG